MIGTLQQQDLAILRMNQYKNGLRDFVACHGWTLPMR
jgi:hypothetical protein